MPEKYLVDFGYINEPTKPLYTPEKARALFGDMSYRLTVNDWAKYKEKYAEWERAKVPGGVNDKAIKQLAEYDRKKDEHDKPFKVKMQRYGFISDFFGIYTKGRFSPNSAGYWGHSDNYGKSTLVQIETWAEYFSFKMTNDDVGLGMMKKYLPNTYKAFEEKYNKLKEK